MTQLSSSFRHGASTRCLPKIRARHFPRRGVGGLQERCRGPLEVGAALVVASALQLS